MTSNVADKFLEYAVNARAAYGTNNSETAPAINGWKAVKVDAFRASSPDFAAQLYTDGQGHYRVAIRGSETSNYLGDFRRADVALASGSWDPQLTDAIRFVGDTIIQIKRTSPGMSLDDIRASIDGSGHSLGGALWELTGKFYGLRGMSIDGPGVSSQTGLQQFTDLKAEYRAKGLNELQDSYNWQAGEFQARRYTIIGSTGTHVPGAEVFTSPKLTNLNAAIGEMDNFYYIPSATTRMVIEQQDAYLSLNAGAALAWHPMASIFKMEGYSNPEAKLSEQYTAQNLAKGLSASGYAAGSKQFEGLGANMAFQVTVYRDAEGRMVEIRVPGRITNGGFEALGAPIMSTAKTTGGVVEAVYVGVTDPSAATASPTVTAPSGFNTPARNSAAFVTDNGPQAHSATIGPGGTVSDLWLVQKNAGNKFTPDEFYKAVQASNPGVTDINNIRAGQVIYRGAEGNDSLGTYGGGAATVIGERGNDMLYGLWGDTRYQWAKGDGNDTIIDRTWITSSESDELRLTDVKPDEVRLTRSGYDMAVHILPTGEVITVKDQLSWHGQIEKISFADGSSWGLGSQSGPNQAPLVAATIADKTGRQGGLFEFKLPVAMFTDPGDLLSFKAEVPGQRWPAWLTFDAATRTFSGTPGNSDVGSLVVKVSASDLAGLSASTTFKLDIANVNDAPTVAGTVPARHITAGTAWRYTVKASFTDVDVGDALSYSASQADGEALPEWLSFDASSRSFSGTPPVGTADVLALRVTATDLAGASVASLFNVTVAPAAGEGLSAVMPAPADRLAGVDGTPRRGSDAADNLIGSSASDAMAGGKGNDTLSGGASGDNYAWATGDGNDVIVDNDYRNYYSNIPVAIDVLKLLNVHAAEVQLSRNTGDLLVTVKPTGETIKVQSHFSGTTFKLESIEVVDGDALQQAELDAAPYRGTDAADTLSGTQADETVIGGKGADTLTGGGGNDRYVWSQGDGNDTINDRDYYATPEDLDTLRLSDVAAGGVQLSRDTANLYISIIATGEKITVSNHFSGTIYKLERIEFSSGDPLLLADLNAAPYRGTPGADTLNGTSSSELFIGGKGVDTISGSTGNDVYQWTTGDGNDILSDYDWQAGNIDTLKLIDVASNGVMLSRDASHLYITVTATGEKIQVSKHFSDAFYKLERIEFSSGDPLLLVDLNAAPYRGTAGNDAISGTSSGETFIAGTGVDTVWGGAGSDVYQWTTGDGNDVISEYDTSAGNIDTLRLTNVAAGGVQLSRDASHFYITVTATGEKITVSDHFTSTAYNLEKIEFSSGNPLLLAELNAAPYRGTDGIDNLYGTSMAETFIGGKSGDVLEGGRGPDVYQWTTGDGNDTIGEYDTTSGAIDTLKLTDVAAGGVQLSRDASHLYIKVLATGERITMANHFTGTTYNLERIEFSSGSPMLLAELNAAPFRGTDAADNLSGSSGGDLLIGGKGADALSGGAAGDVYQWITGDGNDVITEYDTTVGIIDMLRLTDVAAGGVVLNRDASHLYITVTATGEKITISNYFTSTAYNLEKIEFATGNPLLLADLNAAPYRGTTGADTITGTSSAELFIGGKGVDTTSGGTGNDIYQWTTGDGNDVIGEYDSTAGNVDTLRFTDVASSGVQLSRDPSHLYITVTATGEKIQVFNHFTGTAYNLERIEFSSGNPLLLADLNAAPYRGSTGADTITGTSGCEIFIGGKGADNVSGGIGGDVYQWTTGDGNDVITEYDTTAGTIDTLRLTDVAAGGVALSRDTAHLYVTMTATGEKITISNHFTSTAYNLEKIEFSSGDPLLLVDLNAAPYRGTANADTITGTSSAELFIGGKGADTTSGGTGGDVYQWTTGDGNDVIGEYDRTAGNVDTLKLTDVASNGVRLSRSINDLQINVLQTGEAIRVQNYFAGPAYQVERLEFADGSAWNAAQIDQRLNGNTAPVLALAPTNQGATQGVPFSFTLPAGTFTDPGDTITYSATLGNSNALPSWLAFNSATRAFSGTPGNADVGTLAVQVTATDTKGLATQASFSLAVTNVNDAPMLTGAQAALSTGTEDMVYSITQASLLAGFSDVDGDTLSVVNLSAGNGTLSAFNAASGSWTFTSTANFNGTVNLSYGVSDGTATTPVTQSFVLTAVNDAPTLTDAKATLSAGIEDTAYVISEASLLAGFSDWDGNTLSVVNLSASNGGLSAFNTATGSWTFTPNANYSGTVTLNYGISDGMAVTQATQNFVLQPANDFPSGTVSMLYKGKAFTAATTLKQGATLTAAHTLADVDGLGAVSYQWLADGVAIIGATNATLTLSQAQVGKEISVKASYTDGFGTPESMTSVATAAVVNVNDAATGTVTISGNAAQNQVLAAANTLADLDGLGAVRYQWLANGATIAGATGATLTLGQSQVGKAISVKAIYTDGFGKVERVASAATAAVANVNDAPTGVVSLRRGSAALTSATTIQQGQVLSAAVTLVDADGLGSLGYEWQSSADGASWNAVAGATTATLTLTSGLAGQRVRVAVSYIDGGGIPEGVASAATGPVNRMAGTFGADRLAGTLGPDWLEGLAGDDRYTVNDAGDVVVENADEGVDTVTSTVDYVLAANVENLTLGGGAALHGRGNALNNVLTGNAGNNVLDGMGGTDTLIGRKGNDIFLMGRGYGADTVQEKDVTAGDTDVLQFLGDVSASQLWFSKSGNNLQVNIIGTGDTAVLQSWYSGSAYHVEQIKLSDGKVLLDTQVETLVQAMAAFAPPAMGQTSLTAAQQTALAPVLAANWH